DGILRVRDAATGHGERSFPGHLGEVAGVAFSFHGKTLASAGSDKTVRLWDLEKGKEVAVLAGHADTVNAVAFAPSDDDQPRLLASAAADGTLRVWNLRDEMNPRPLRGHAAGVTSVALGGSRLASCSPDEKSLRLWDALAGAEVARIPCNAYAAAFSTDGLLLVTGGGDAFQTNRPGELKVWDGRTGQPIRELPGHTKFVFAVALSRDGRRIAS